MQDFGPRPILGMTIQEYSVGEWCPTPDGTGPAQAVVIELIVKQLPMPLCLRLKSRKAVNEMIAMLTRHRDGVFGKLQNGN